VELEIERIDALRPTLRPSNKPPRVSILGAKPRFDTVRALPARWR